MFAVDSFTDAGIGSEDFDLIPTNQDLYACDPDLNGGTIFKLSHTFLNNCVGALLITQAGDGTYNSGGARLFIVQWSGTNFVTRAITDSTVGHLEHITFAPINLPSQPIQ
jgi:hypothetical protein